MAPQHTQTNKTNMPIVHTTINFQINFRVKVILLPDLMIREVICNHFPYKIVILT